MNFIQWISDSGWRSRSSGIQAINMPKKRIQGLTSAPPPLDLSSKAI
jgi:hypothetical protein